MQCIPWELNLTFSSYNLLGKVKTQISEALSRDHGRSVKINLVKNPLYKESFAWLWLMVINKQNG